VSTFGYVGQGLLGVVVQVSVTPRILIPLLEWVVPNMMAVVRP
jgi:hypothetical protein